MKTRTIIFSAILLSVFLVGISAICADDSDDAFGSKKFNINGTEFTTPDETTSASSHGFNASFVKNGYVCDVKVISDVDYNKYKKWISDGKDDNNVSVAHYGKANLVEIYQTWDKDNNTMLFMLFEKDNHKFFAQIHGDANHKNPKEMSGILEDFVDSSFLTSVFDLG